MANYAKLLDLFHLADTLNWLDEFCPADSEWRAEVEPGKVRIVNDIVGELTFGKQDRDTYSYDGGTYAGSTQEYDRFERLNEFVLASFQYNFANL